MVTLYLTDITPLPDPKEAQWLLPQLTTERREKTLKYIQADDRKRCLAAGLLLREVLPRYGVQPDEIQIGDNDKPEVKGICFNLSHSGSLVICAVGTKAVGCDVEKITKAPKEAAERFFHPNENNCLNNCTQQNYDEVFFRFWTMKESYVKMTGEGMSLPFDQFEVIPEETGASVRRGDRLLPCRIHEYTIPGYQVAVCTEEACSPDLIKLSV